ncbi:hypothetical protein HDU84_003330 [Entophlyctis sp. JEL0112]|nr:hypothetical protein HDU84_003330 [Entophlyctis sp. JEL0112]
MSTGADNTSNPNPLVAPFIAALMRLAFGAPHVTRDQLALLLDSCKRRFPLHNAVSLDRFVASLNQSHLLPLDLRLASMTHPVSGALCYSLVNCSADSVAAIATSLTPSELALFKRIVHLIMTADDDVFQVSSILAIREGRSLKMTASAAESAIDSFIDAGWLLNSDGWLSLSLRTIMELKTYLRQEFEDYVLNCSVCKEIVTTHHERCSMGGCPGRLHKFCANRFFGSNDRKCPHPGCGSAWEGITPKPNSSGANTRKQQSVVSTVDQAFFEKHSSRSRRASRKNSNSSEEIYSQVDDDDDDGERRSESAVEVVVENSGRVEKDFRRKRLSSDQE